MGQNLVIWNTRNRKPGFAVYPIAKAGYMELRKTVRGYFLREEKAIDELGEFYD